MPKTCTVEGCKSNQFGGGYCKFHQRLRTDKKPTPKKNKKPIRKVSAQHRKRLGERRLLRQEDWLFYLKIWDEREHICFETDEYLGDEPLTTFFHHVLEKGIEKYEKYRHCKWNIVLISWQVHDQVHKNIDKCPKIKKYRDYILKKYVK